MKLAIFWSIFPVFPMTNAAFVRARLVETLRRDLIGPGSQRLCSSIRSYNSIRPIAPSGGSAFRARRQSAFLARERPRRADRRAGSWARARRACTASAMALPPCRALTDAAHRLSKLPLVAGQWPYDAASALRSRKALKLLAGGPGFEPRLTESESAVLPLNYPPMEPLALRCDAMRRAS